MINIYLLTDYKNQFGSKQKSAVYRGGMNLELLKEYFREFNYELQILTFSEIIFRADWKNKLVLYTSSEDFQECYKQYIEDIILGLENAGAILIPKYKFLKAHNDKVFMEILKDQNPLQECKTIETKYFGTKQELQGKIEEIQFPAVVKTYAGAMSRGVYKAENKLELIKIATKIGRTFQFKHEFRDFVRAIRHKGYIRNSKYRKRFIVQNLIPNLTNDWKILVYGDYYYALKRNNRPNDFRASGSGLFEFNTNFPEGMFHFAKNIYESFNVPQISIDVGYDGKDFHLIEFQFLYFGTTTQEKSPHYIKYENEQWNVVKEKIELEYIYVKSIVDFIVKK